MKKIIDFIGPALYFSFFFGVLFYLIQCGPFEYLVLWLPITACSPIVAITLFDEKQ